MNFSVAEEGDAFDGGKTTVSGPGVLRGDDVSFNPNQLVATYPPLLWSGGAWGPPAIPHPAPSGGLASFYTPPPGSGVRGWHGDGGVPVSPAPPVSLVLDDVTCDDLGGTASVPFWAHPGDVHVAGFRPPLAISLRRGPCRAS